MNNVLSLTSEKRAWGIPEKRDAMSRPSWEQCRMGQSTSDTANVNVYNLSDVMLLEEIYEHFFQARSSILFSASLPDRPPHRNTGVELSNICQQKIECNYPQRNPKYLPGTLVHLLLWFLISNPCHKCKALLRSPPKRWMCTKKIQQVERRAVAQPPKWCVVGIHQRAIKLHEDVRPA